MRVSYLRLFLFPHPCMDGHHVDDDSVSESAVFVDGDISDGGDPVSQSHDSNDAASHDGDIDDNRDTTSSSSGSD